MTAFPSVGRALRRFRRLNGIKQSHLADVLGVSQGAVSRWESGAHEPDAGHRDRIVGLLAAHANNDADAALRRLVVHSRLAVHLVCDTTHRLLAASKARERGWAVRADGHLGRSLWRFASAEIVAAEDSLAARGWFERPCQSLRFETGANRLDDFAIAPSVLQWETVPLADGRVGRLTTTIA